MSEEIIFVGGKMFFLKKTCLSKILIALSFFLIRNGISQNSFYLTLNPGIKSNAMGGAQTAISNDYLSFYYNPAGLSKISKTTLGYSNTTYTAFNKIHSYFGGVGVKISNWAIGFAVYHFSTQVFREEIKETSYQVSIARKVSNHLRFGASLKYLYENIRGFSSPIITYPGSTSSAFTGDLGLLLENLLPRITFGERKENSAGISLGVSILNTGPDKTSNDLGNPGDPLPQMLKLGIGYNTIQTSNINLIVALDLTKILVRHRIDGTADGFFKAWFTSWKNSGFDNLNVGTDLTFFDLFSVYLGYDKQFNSLLNKSYTFTYGFGISAPNNHLNIQVFHRVYPVFLNDINQTKIWRFGLSLNY